MALIDLDAPVGNLIDLDTYEPPPEPDRGNLRAIGDTAVQFGKGAVSGVRMLSDVFGADNPVSGGLRSATEALDGLLSATAQQDQRRVAEIMQEAEGKGWMEQIAIGLKAAGVAPGALLAQAAGTAVPTIAASMIPGVGQAGLIGRLGLGAGVGAAQGAGVTKGSIYETVKSELLAAGASEEEAERRAVERQSYAQSGGQIALGAGLGALAGSTGIERAGAALRAGVTKAPAGLIGRAGMGAVTEAVPEFAQGAQEKFATNTALANEGFDVDPMSGVVAGATLEGIAGAGLGAAFGVPAPRVQAQPEPPQADPLQLGNTPDPLISFPDGTVGRRSEVDAYINTLPEEQRNAARAKFMGMGPKDIPDILSAGSVDEAIAAASAAISAPLTLTGQSRADLMAPPEGIIGAARAYQEQVANDQDELDSFVQSEARDLNTLRAQTIEEMRKQAELDQIQATGTGQYGVPIEARPAVEQAAALEAPTALQLAMQRARERAKSPDGQQLQAGSGAQADAGPVVGAPRESAIPAPVRGSERAGIPDGLGQGDGAAGERSAGVQPPESNQDLGQREADERPVPQGDERAAGILPGDIARLDGRPFQTANGARLKQREAGGIDGSDVVEVPGGFVVRPKTTTAAAPDAGAVASDAPAQVQPLADSAAAPTDPAQPNIGALKETPSAQTAEAIEGTPEQPGAEVPAAGQPAAVAAVPEQVEAGQSAGALTGEKIDREWTAFTPESGTKGIPRAEMPQIKAEHRGAMTQFLAARGITHENVEVPAGDLKPTQAEFSPGKVAKAKGYTDTDRSILISSDGHVLDGHHQWLAKMESGEPIKAIRLAAPIDQLLREVKEFPSAQAAAGATKPVDQRLVPVSRRGKVAPSASDPEAGAASRSSPVSQAAEVRPATPPKAAPMVESSVQPSPNNTADPRLTPVSKRVAEPKKKAKPANALRRAAYDRNPMLTFLATHGLFHDKDKPGSQKSEFSPDKAVMVMGYGPVFRKTGLMPDLLVARAIEDGYLPADGTEAQLVDLIRRAIGGEKILPIYAEGVADSEMERQTAAREALEEDAAQADNTPIPSDPEGERVAVDDVVAMSDAELLALDDEIPWDAPSNADMETAMRSMGFSEQEIKDAIAQEQGVAQEGGEGGAVLAETAAGQAPGDREQRTAQARSGAESEGLTAPTRADVLRQQAQAEAEAQRREDGGDKPLPGKKVTGDTPDMFNTQGSVFDQPADPEPATQAATILDAANVTGKDRLDILKDVKSGALTPGEVQAAYPQAKPAEPVAPEAAPAPAAVDAAPETPDDDAGNVSLFARSGPSLPDVSDPQTGISTALLDLGKNDALYQYPKSDATDLKEMAADKSWSKGGRAQAIEVGPVDRDTQDENLWILANTTPRDGPTTKSWMLTMPDGKRATLTRNGDEVYINAAGLEEGGGGSAVYDLAANFALNNGLVFIGDPNGLSTSALRRRLENMLSSAVKYGTTDHLAPHPKQLAGSKLAKVPPLQWTPGDTLGNIRSMVDASVAATKSANPNAADNVRFDPATQSFVDQWGQRLNDAGVSGMLGFDERVPGTGQAGRTTLQRNALFQSLLQSEGARRALLESVRGQSDRAGSQSGGLAGTFYSRQGVGPFSRQGGRGVSMDDAYAIRDAVRKALPTAPPIYILESVDKAPKKLLAKIKEAGAERDVDAALHYGEIYVFPGNIGSVERMMFVLAHHEIRHFGFSAMLGPDAGPIFLDIHATNPKIRELAAEQVEKGYADSRVLAVEEALADMPVDELVKLNGFDKVIAALRTWLRSVAANLRRRGFAGLADAVDPKVWTDKDVAALIARAEGVSRGGSARYASEGTVFSNDEKAGEDDADARFARSASVAQPKDGAFGVLSAAQEKALRSVAAFTKQPTMKERAESFKANLGMRVTQGIVDQFRPIRDVSQEAYMQARLSKGSDGTMEAAMLYGKPFLRDGVPDVDVKDGGFGKVLASLKGEHDRFLWWVAAQRAERLKSEGKENLFTDQDISTLKTLNAGKMVDGSSRPALYERALLNLNAFNESVLKMAEESGLIDAEARALFKDQPYVPFYRQMEEGMQGPRFSSGLVGQKAFQKLKGGTKQLNADLLENMLLNWSHLYSAAARNRAAMSTMDAAEKLAVAYKVPAEVKGAVKVMRNGVAEHWAIEDPFLMEAVTALHYVPSPLIKPLATAKRWLTWGVTINPTFKIRNLIRDSLSAIAQGDLSYNPLENVAKGWKATSKDSQTYASMLASGGVIKFGTTEDSGRVRREIDKLGGTVLDKEGFAKLSGLLGTAWDAYNELGDRAENVNRTALYDRLIEKGHSHAEASFMARDLMDFSMSGRWEAVRFLAQTVPFLNARLQGLYKLGRAAQQDPRRFATMAMAVSMASLALMAAYGDDDDWKRREDWDRDSNWWFKIGNEAYRVPKPFELGSVGTLAERTAELMLSKEMTGERFRERLSAMLFQTFSMDPVPQAFKPLLDVYSNRDSFTKREIEGMGDERLRPQDRISERTSEVARFLGQLGLPEPLTLLKGEYRALSPKQVDFLLRGYFSWAGTSVAAVSDIFARPLMGRGDRPDMRLKDAFLLGNFVESLPSGSSRYVSTMYQQARDVEQAYASYRDALKRGDLEKAAKIQEEEAPKLRARVAVERAKLEISKINAQARRIEADRLMSGTAKRARLEELEQRRDKIARRVAVPS